LTEGTERRGAAKGLEEGVEVGRRVRIPGSAERPIQVFVNGIEQVEGTDYEIHGREIVFAKPIVKEGKLGALRWLAMWSGLFGTYRRNESVDVHFRRHGKTEVAVDAEVLPD